MPTQRPQQPGAVTSTAGGINPPFQGIFLDRPSHIVPSQGFSACNNIRIHLNQVQYKDMGWAVQLFGATHGQPLNIPAFDTPSIMGGGLFTLSTAGWQYLIVITGGGDIYAVSFSSPPAGFVDPTVTGNATFITPVYNTGQASCSGTGAVTGSSTHWNTAIGTGFRNNARPGDYIYFGDNAHTDPRSTWYEINTVVSDTSLTLLTVGPNTGGNVNYTIRQRLSPNLGNSRPVMESFPNAGTPDNQDLLFIADGGGFQRGIGSVDPIVAWNPTQASAVYMSSFGFSAKKLRRFSNVMIYGDLWGVSGGTPTGWLGSTSIQSSDNGLPKSVASGVAFQGVVSDGAEPIQHLGVLGNQLLIYTGGQAPNTLFQSMSPGQGGSVVAASFVGAPTIWQFSTVIRGRGTLGQGLVAEFADRHQFLAQDGEYRYNGMFLQVMNDHVFRRVVKTLDFGSLQQAFNIVDPQVGDVIWVLPTSINGTVSEWAAYVEHYMEQANNYLFKPISIRDAGDQNTGISWQCFMGAMPAEEVLALTGHRGPLIGDSSGNILQIGQGAGNTQTWGAGSPQSITGTATFGARIVSGERSRGLVKRVYPFADEVSSSPGAQVTVSLQLQDRIGGPLAIIDNQTYTLGTVNRFTTHYRRGRVAQVQFIFQSTAAGLIFFLDGYDWDLPSGSPGGQR